MADALDRQACLDPPTLAQETGHESEAAISQGFKRLIGQPPAIGRHVGQGWGAEKTSAPDPAVPGSAAVRTRDDGTPDSAPYASWLAKKFARSSTRRKISDLS